MHAELIRQLNSPSDVDLSTNAVNTLISLAENSDKEALAVLLEYAQSGQFKGLRRFVMASLAQSSIPDLTDFFTAGLSNPELGFWSVLGCIRHTGVDSYPALVALVLNKDVPIVQRAYAVRLLSIHSGQPFSQGCPRDSETWTEASIRVAELKSWADAGFPLIELRERPNFIPAALPATTPLERAINLFSEKLLEERNRDPEDFINPSNLLRPCDKSLFNEILGRFRLPKNYRCFLENYSPTNFTCLLTVSGSAENLQLYSGADLINNQELFSGKNPTGVALSNWNPDYLVIADSFLDPFVIDMKESSRDDSPIYFARHGERTWKFRKYCNSFVDFLNRIKVDPRDFSSLQVK